MISDEELVCLLRKESMQPPPFPLPQPISDGTIVLMPEQNFRAGEMVSIHVHPDHSISPVSSGQLSGVHSHNFIEVAFVWDGTCGMEVEGTPFELGPGDFVILDTNSSHRIFETDDTLLINISIRTEFFDDTFFRYFENSDVLATFFANTVYSEKAVKRFLVFRTGNDTYLRHLLQLTLKEYYSRETAYQAILENYITILLLTMVRLQRQEIADVTAKGAGAESQATEIIRFMNDNLSHVSREMVADRFGYSYSYITNVLKSITGLSFSGLKKALRIQKAEQLLRTTERPISVIAQEVGFSNSYAFYEEFKQNYGVTPSEYRTK